MATQVQRRRGTASEHNTFTGAAGEVTVNTTNDSVHVHDGATAGGFETMRVDGDNSQVPLGPSGIQVFENSGTWTKPAGVNFVRVTVTGGGGGGGGGQQSFNNGGSGSAGGTAIKVIDVSTTSSVSVTVGSGGGGGGGVSRGSAGSSSSFGSFCSATGGGGGGYHTDPLNREGGEGVNGDINVDGGYGHFAGGGTSADEPSPGQGGASYWGSGGATGAARTTAVDDGQAGKVYGSGGGGGNEISGPRPGGNGADGVVVVEEFA